MCFQKKDQSLEDYTKEFKMRLQVIETLGILVGEDNTTVKLICAKEGLDWMMVLSNQAKLNEYRKKMKERYAAVLHFNGLNLIAYRSLKNKIKND